MIKLKSILSELHGADVRCSNFVLNSFGICVPNAVMTADSLLTHIKKKYSGKHEVKVYNLKTEWEYLHFSQKWPAHSDKGKLSKPYLVPFFGDLNVKVEPFGWGIPQPTVRKLGKYLQETKAYGHYILIVPNHALAIHYTQRYGFYVIDTQRKFLSGRKVKDLYIIQESAKPLHAFNTFLETTERHDEIKKY